MPSNDSYVVDTHSLVWFIATDRRLARRAHEILREADEGLHDVIVPTIVLVETLDIVEKHKVNVDMATILGWIRSSARFVVRPWISPCSMRCFGCPAGLRCMIAS